MVSHSVVVRSVFLTLFHLPQMIHFDSKILYKLDADSQEHADDVAAEFSIVHRHFERFSKILLKALVSGPSQMRPANCAEHVALHYIRFNVFITINHINFVHITFLHFCFHRV